jgi:limonene-1,2-epoxide hydrolase
MNEKELEVPNTLTNPTEVVEAFLHAFVAMDFDTALSFIADDCEYTNIPMGTVTGPSGINEVLGPFFAPIHENEFIILRKADYGHIVFMERLDRHRLDHGWRELPVNSVFEVHDGLITVWRDYFDLGTAAKIHQP